MVLAKFWAELLIGAPNSKQALPSLAAAIGSIVVNTVLIVSAVLNSASPRYLPELMQFKGNGLIAVAVVGAVSLPGLQTAPNVAVPTPAAPLAAAVPPSGSTEPVKAGKDSLTNTGGASQIALPESTASAAALASAEVDEYARPSMFLMRQLRMIAGDQLVELRVSIMLSDSGEVESLEIVSTRGDIRVIASWISVLRSARFYPPTKQLQGVASKLVFEFSTYDGFESLQLK